MRAGIRACTMVVALAFLLLIGDSRTDLEEESLSDAESAVPRRQRSIKRARKSRWMSMTNFLEGRLICVKKIATGITDFYVPCAICWGQFALSRR
jgi:hypothetical protein